MRVLKKGLQRKPPASCTVVFATLSVYSTLQIVIDNSKNRKAEPNDPAFLGLFVPVFSDFIFLLVPANPIIPKPRNSMMAGSDIVCSI